MNATNPIISEDLPPELVDGIMFYRVNTARNAFATAQREAIRRFCEAIVKEVDYQTANDPKDSPFKNTLRTIWYEHAFTKLRDEVLEK